MVIRFSKSMWLRSIRPNSALPESALPESAWPAPAEPDILAHLAALQHYALVLTRDRDQAEDLVQDTLARAIEGAGGWRPGSDLQRWLLSILHNAHVSRQRRRQAEARATEQAGWLAEAAAPPSQLAHVALSQTIAALLALPEEQREALILVAFRGVTYKDAADILGVPTGTLMSRLARGREALRAATDHQAPESSPSAAPPRPALRVVK